MPLYAFENVKHPHRKQEFFFTMKEAPKVSEVIKDDEGVEWKRIFTLPNASIDSRLNPNSVQDFVEKTGKKKGSYGDILDASKELSDKRAKDNGGTDPVQKKFFKDYSAKRGGIKHLEEKRKTVVDKEHFTITYK